MSYFQFAPEPGSQRPPAAPTAGAGTENNMYLLPPEPPRPPPRPSGLGAPPRRSRQKIVVEPTPEKQTIYNRIREEVARQQHEHSQLQGLRPPTQSRSAPMSRASSCSGTSPTAAPETSPARGEPHKRPRGRRGGPLDHNTRFKTAVRRALKLVCEECRSRKVACNCYDLSRLEEVYKASHGSSTSASIPGSHSRASSRVASSPRRTEPYLAGLENSEPATDIPMVIADSDWGELSNLAQPPNPRPHIQDYAAEFDTINVLPGVLSTPVTVAAYNPGLGSSMADGATFPDVVFPVGSEIAENAGRWRCEFVPTEASEICSWTGLVKDLGQHWKTSHHPIRETEKWCECLRCFRLRFGWDKPYMCLDEACSPTGAVWKRWLYGHTLVESTIASTPALTTRSGESENGSFDTGASWNPMPPDSQNGFFGPSDPLSNSSSHFNLHGYRKEGHSAEDGGESSGHAHEHTTGSPSGLPVSNCQPPLFSKGNAHTAHEPRPPRVSLGLLGCNASHPSFSWARKMPQIFCTLVVSGVATAIFEPRCFLGANIIDVAHAFSTALTVPWISLFLICSSFVVTWLVQTRWSAARRHDSFAALAQVPNSPGSIRMPDVVVSRPDSSPRRLQPYHKPRQLPGSLDTVDAVG